MLVLNEMVLVLEARGSSTSTSTAGAEHEYESHGISRRSGTGPAKSETSKIVSEGTTYVALATRVNSPSLTRRVMKNTANHVDASFKTMKSETSKRISERAQLLLTRRVSEGLDMDVDAATQLGPSLTRRVRIGHIPRLRVGIGRIPRLRVGLGWGMASSLLKRRVGGDR